MIFNADTNKPAQEVPFSRKKTKYKWIVNNPNCEKLESVQYKAALAITGAMQGTSCDKTYQELGLKSIKSRR